MSIFTIAWRSVQQRGLASALTTLSMALGVMLVVIVLSVHGVVAESFRNNSSLGYNLIVGAKGGKLQLTLNTVYYLSAPVENLPYDFYLEFLPAKQRRAELQHSLEVRGHQMQTRSLPLQSIAAAAAGHPTLSFANQLLVPEAYRAWSEGAAGLHSDGRFAQFTALAIPLCMGDYFREYRVVGTTPAMFDDRIYDEERGRKFEFAEGRNFKTYTKEHGYFEAVVGARVARQAQLEIGDVISPSHGDPEGEAHGQGFTVVGILAPSGTPNDRAVFVNMEGFFLMDDHAKPIESPEEEEPAIGFAAVFGGGGLAAGDEELAAEDEELTAEEEESAGTAEDQPLRPLPVEQREVTAILLRTANPVVAPGVMNAINEGQIAQAVPPVREIYNLLDMIVGPILLLLMVLTVLICIVSGVSILVSIYNSMNDRKREIAIMRSLGAGRSTVMTVILLEAGILALGGGLLGWFLGHSANALASPIIEARTGVSIGFFDLAPGPNLLDLLALDLTIDKETRELFRVSTELLLIPGLMLLAVIVGFLPAMAAYRTDVAKTLAS